MRPTAGQMSQLIPSHVLRVGQTICLSQQAELTDIDPDSPTLDVSLDTLNQLILELDPSFEPLPLHSRSERGGLPPGRTQGADSPDEDVSQAVLVPRGCSSHASSGPAGSVSKVSRSRPIPARSPRGSSCSPNGTLVFSSSPSASSTLPPLPCSRPRATGAFPPQHGDHQLSCSPGALPPTRHRVSASSLLSTSPGSDTSYITGSCHSLLSADAESSDQRRFGFSGSFTPPPPQAPPALTAPPPLPGDGSGALPSMKFVMDTSQFWFRPHITREEADALLRDREPGSFIVRDSTSYRGSFGLALKVQEVPASASGTGKSGDNKNLISSLPGEGATELVRHYLIESSARGVRLKGSSEEPYFAKCLSSDAGSLSALVYQHAITSFALPCKLLIPGHGGTPCSPTPPGCICREIKAQQSVFSGSLSHPPLPSLSPAACNFLFLSSVNTETLTGPLAVQKAVSVTFQGSALPTPTIVNLKVSAQGVTLTDVQRKLFFRRHYPTHLLSYCGEDPEGRKWQKDCRSARIFGFVAKGPDVSMENVCHLFAEYDSLQPASTAISLVTSLLAQQEALQ
ncbi:TENS4 protein, partial [Atractosteus spatula]|nr:TENS4 protein [Atractosteus spatula]